MQPSKSLHSRQGLNSAIQPEAVPINILGHLDQHGGKVGESPFPYITATMNNLPGGPKTQLSVVEVKVIAKEMSENEEHSYWVNDTFKWWYEYGEHVAIPTSQVIKESRDPGNHRAEEYMHLLYSKRVAMPSPEKLFPNGTGHSRSAKTKSSPVSSEDELPSHLFKVNPPAHVFEASNVSTASGSDILTSTLPVRYPSMGSSPTHSLATSANYDTVKGSRLSPTAESFVCCGTVYSPTSTSPAAAFQPTTKPPDNQVSKQQQSVSPGSSTSVTGQ